MIFTAMLDAPENHAPAAHSGIVSKMPWIDILNGLPRTGCAESRVLQEAWRSVGLPNPESWGPGATADDVF